MAVTVAMVLAAGFGTRLSPLTDELPKPLVPVGDRSVLSHVVTALEVAGVRRVVINAHHHPEAIAAAAPRLALPATVSVEREILGTAGGLRHARAPLGEGPVLVHNGDILADLDLAALVAGFERTRPFALLAIVGGLPAGAGNVGLDGARVVRLRDQRFGEETAGGRFVGVQVVSHAARQALPARGCLVGDVYLPALARGEPIEAAPLVAWFDDIGTPAAYLQANRRWLAGRGGRTVGATAPAGITLEETVVGAGAHLEGHGTIARSVIWPGARARAPLADAIVTPRGVVQVTASPETTSPPS